MRRIDGWDDASALDLELLIRLEWSVMESSVRLLESAAQSIFFG